MLMELLLLKNLFARPEVAYRKEKWVTSSSSRFVTSFEPQKGVSTWSKRGEWIEGNSSNRTRLLVGQNPQMFVAMQEMERRNVFQRCKDFFTHVKVFSLNKDGTKEIVSLNLGSLSKRIQVSIAAILFLRFTGRLTIDFVERCAKQALERNVAFDNIISKSRARALGLNKDPAEAEEEVKGFLASVAKARRLSEGIFVNIDGRTYVAHRNPKHIVTFGEKGKLLGSGAWGKVYLFDNYSANRLDAIKISQKAEKNSAIRNESRMLNFIHREGVVEGAQQAPYFLVNSHRPKSRMALVTQLLNFCLKENEFLERLPLWDKLTQSKALFYALHVIHNIKQSVHGDIKPHNTCSVDGKLEMVAGKSQVVGGKLQFIDFGDARRKRNITLDHPLGMWTPYYTALSSQVENYRITYTFYLHQIAEGKIKSLLEKAWILQEAIRVPTLNIDREAARLTLASLILKLKKEDLEKHQINPADYKAEIDIVTKRPQEFNRRHLDLSRLKLNQAQLDKLKEDSLHLCLKHDVYGLGITLLCLYSGKVKIPPEDFEAELKDLRTKIASDPACKKFIEVVPLIADMLAIDKKGQQPSSEEAFNRFSAIQKRAGG